MSTAASGLKELHQLHQQLAQAQSELARGPKQIDTRRKITAAKEKELQEMQQQLKNLRMQADQKSLQLKTNEQKITELKVKLNSATSNREFDIFKSQIEADTMANSVLEDEILEALEKVDRMQSSIASMEEQLQQCRADEKRIAEEVAAASPALEEQIIKIQSALESAESVLPDTLIERYRRLVQAHGSEALASVENKACSACHSLLSPQCSVNVNTGKVVFCRACGRILYRADES